MAEPLTSPTAVRTTADATARRTPLRFIFTGQVSFDALDAMGMVHNSRYGVLDERANSALFQANGWRFEANPALNPDQFYVVWEQSGCYLEPAGSGDFAVETLLNADES